MSIDIIQCSISCSPLQLLRAVLIITILTIVTNSDLNAQKRRYKKQLEPNSTFIAAGRNYMVESLDDTTYIAKWFYPETKKLIKRETFYKKDFTVKHGPYLFVYDDGTIVDQGEYRYNTKVGPWIESVYYRGEYINGRKSGVWTTVNDKGQKVREDQYAYGGSLVASTLYDSLGNIRSAPKRDQGQGGIISMVAEVLPVYGQCDASLSREEIKKCTSKNILTYLSSNLKYPRKSRERDVQGRAYIDFYIETDGSIQDVIPRSGVSDVIRDYCVVLIKQMGDWTPGFKNGKPFRVKYTLPITFQIL